MTSAREGALVRITGVPPRTARPPEPRVFEAAIGGQHLRFGADYGVFSPEGVDDGTRLLADVALQGPPVDVVADIGVGYGVLAIGLVRNGIARRAVGTDVDCVALWLARRNAAASRVQLAVEGASDPAVVEDTALTVCNVPTHINAARTADLMRSLARRARGGRRLLIVVHASLENRYADHLRGNGLIPVTTRTMPGRCGAAGSGVK
jgi:16S rRNA G1207 methylase RsmC